MANSGEVARVKHIINAIKQGATAVGLSIVGLLFCPPSQQTNKEPEHLVVQNSSLFCLLEYTKSPIKCLMVFNRVGSGGGIIGVAESHPAHAVL